MRKIGHYGDTEMSYMKYKLWYELHKIHKLNRVINWFSGDFVTNHVFPSKFRNTWKRMVVGIYAIHDKWHLIPWQMPFCPTFVLQLIFKNRLNCITFLNVFTATQRTNYSNMIIFNSNVIFLMYEFHSKMCCMIFVSSLRHQMLSIVER